MTDLAELRAAHMALARHLMPEHLRRLTWDQAALDAHRGQALRALLKAAADRSPWHRERLAGVSLDAVRPDDLSSLPTMTKTDVTTAFDDIVTDPRVRLREVEDALADGSDHYLCDEYTPAATGGSTGQRTVMLFDRFALATWWVSAMRSLLAWRLTQSDLKDRQLVFAWIGAAHSSHMSAVLARTFNDPAFRNVSLPVTSPIQAIVQGLNDAQPDAVAVYPSVLPALVREAEAGRLRIAPRRMMPMGEPLLPEIRAMVEAMWPAPVDNRWGCTEGGALVEPCGLGFNHLLEDTTILEVVDGSGRPVPPGERGTTLLCTNLFSHALPLIRYEITDEVTILPGRCDCGAPTARAADVQGRLDELFRYPTADVHPHLFRSVLGRRPEIAEYQVRQTANGAEIAVRCAQPLNLAEVAAEIERDLRVAGQFVPQVSVHGVETLERLPQTGKLKRFIPLPVTS